MTVRANTHLGRGAETHITSITPTGNLIIFRGHYKLGISARTRDDIFSPRLRWTARDRPPARAYGSRSRTGKSQRRAQQKQIEAITAEVGSRLELEQACNTIRAKQWNINRLLLCLTSQILT
jgi:hypothetical protein